MEKVMTVKECLAYMETGQVFTAKVVKFDESRKKGGGILEMEAVFLPATKRERVDGQRLPTEVEQKRMQLAALRRNPKHKKHYTRNVALCVNAYPTSEIRKIHPPLLIVFNGIKVVP